VTIEFENVDYRVALRVDGTEVVATADSDYRPDIARLLAEGDGAARQSRVEIMAQLLPLELRHVTVHRDVFYRSDVHMDVFIRKPSQIEKRNHDYPGSPGWGTARRPILLRADPGDYFCCGDNSPQSKDSRLWWEIAPSLAARGSFPDAQAYQPGTVPADQMIGRAFFVYWPSGYRLFSRFGLIPNVGRMRIIR
jgi:hypothetical protein